MADQQCGKPNTRQRLLEAAGEVFAEQGFRNATVRGIVRRADANLNAVNYYFGDKQGLYQAVIEYAHQSIEHEHELASARDAASDPAERLLAFVRVLLRRVTKKGHSGWHGKLMAMEMAEPTEVLDIVVARFIRPRFGLLVGIIRDLVGEETPQRQIELCAESVVAQCIHFVHGRAIITRLMPFLTYSEADIDMMAHHVTQFSLAGLKSLAKTQGTKP
ncbi:MAG TPA: CerR family C-terminal domain-containing protein [Phycisphaerae bacterium]|nr:CerR family C-terminal domain-containing protein [Phycisphaerae bacterium]